MNWTKQQEQAIEARGCSVIVSAAAGSGKTAVLTERLVQLLADPESGISADRIVVVTFTNDAAAEMKSRLDQRLRELINTDPSNQHLLKQQVLLQSARISTINAFCFDLLRDNISDQGITSGFGVLDDTDSKVLRSRAMDDFFQWYTENDYETLSRLYDHFCSKSEAGLIDVIQSADSFLGSVAVPEKWLDKICQEYEKPFRESVYYKRLIQSVTGILKEAQRLAEADLDTVSHLFDQIREGRPSGKLYDKVLDDRERVLGALGVLEEGELLSDEQAAELDKLIGLTSLGKEEYDQGRYELFKARRKELKELLTKAKENLLSAENDYLVSREVTGLLVKAVRKYRELIWERKCRKNALSFDDGERLVLELLSRQEGDQILQSETAQRIAQSCDMIMIDEYQDSNNKQDLIFKLMSRNYKLSETGQPMYGDNVFLVGDVKQCIYRFRLANPGNFIETMKSSVPYDEEGDYPNRSIVLNQNFRSSPEVIDFVNYVFSNVMSEEVGEIAYTDQEKLYFGAEPYFPPDKSRLTHFSFIIDDPGSEEKIPAGTEARAVAQQIAQMIRSGAEVIDKKGGRRPCRPSDFCVLVRKNEQSRMYAEALLAEGVAAEGSEEKGYLKSREITVLIDLLRVISNPLQDVPLAAVMTSPMFMFTIGDLALLRSLDRRSSLYSVVTMAAKGELSGLSDSFLPGKCRALLAQIDRFRLDSVTMTIGELIRSIYDATDFISVMQLSGNGEKKRANLRALIQYARSFEESTAFEGSGGLSSFLRHIDRIMKTGDYAQGKIAQASGDYVSVQTLHGSKGLEYPFVFIAECTTGFKYDSNAIMCSDDGRVGYTLYDKKTVQKFHTFQQLMLIEERKNSSRSEEMRLLYVGLTRARQQLFISVKCGEPERKRLSSIIRECRINGDDPRDTVRRADCFSDWLWSCLILHSEFPAIAEALGVDGGEFGYPEPKESRELFTWQTLYPEETSAVEEASDIPEALPDEKITQRLREIIAAPYDKELSETPARLSVTQLSHRRSKQTPFDLRLERPRFITGSQKLTGSERGTAIHTFFQYCDFPAAMADPGAEIERIGELGYLSGPEEESIDRDKVSAFFRSGLYGRISSAKRVWREKKFMAAVAELPIEDPSLDKLRRSDGMIKGIIDLMFEEEDGIFIVDYKSDRGVSEEKLRERYTMQLRLYKAAVELTTGKKVIGASLYSFELEKEIPVKI
ncbi:MAG: helicase-exonuclease AddAB subunit AddA [Ruminococcus sp.]|nr:helicase-exonuclease AddAB subunit AddA [Ruminococcus sp.]